jgi:hypothetical protein
MDLEMLSGHKGACRWPHVFCGIVPVASPSEGYFLSGSHISLGSRASERSGVI